MQKDSFLIELQKRAAEQKTVMSGMPLPTLFIFISRVFGESPWKILIPLSIVITIACQLLWRNKFDDAILWVFGSL